MTSRSYVFTQFTYDVNEPELYRDQLELLPYIRYGIYQEEVCPKTDKSHLQGYLEFTRGVRIAAIKRVLGDQIHLERRKGTRDQARDYCRKEDTRKSGPYELGDWGSGGRGKRCDLLEVQALLDTGVGLSEVAEAHFGTFIKYHNGLAKYVHLRSGVRQEKTKLIILWGKAGTGKTRTVWDDHGYDAVYPVPQPNGGSVWFDGMGRKPVCLLDDFYGWIPLHLLLKMADRYPLSVPIKGGMTPFLCTHLYITSNKHYREWYNWNDLGNNLLEAFERRIDEIKEF